MTCDTVVWLMTPRVCLIFVRQLEPQKMSRKESDWPKPGKIRILAFELFPLIAPLSVTSFADSLSHRCFKQTTEPVPYFQKQDMRRHKPISLEDQDIKRHTQCFDYRKKTNETQWTWIINPKTNWLRLLFTNQFLQIVDGVLLALNGLPHQVSFHCILDTLPKNKLLLAGRCSYLKQKIKGLNYPSSWLT